MEEIKIEYYADIKNYFEAAKYFTKSKIKRNIFDKIMEIFVLLIGIFMLTIGNFLLGIIFFFFFYATNRIYNEQYQADPSKHARHTQTA